MKKIFSSLIIAVFAVAFMATGAWATTITVTPNDDTTLAPYKFPIESYQTNVYTDFTVNTSVAGANDAVITVEIVPDAINTADLIVTFDNALVAAPDGDADTYVLILDDATVGGGAADGKVSASDTDTQGDSIIAVGTVSGNQITFANAGLAKDLTYTIVQATEDTNSALVVGELRITDNDAGADTVYIFVSADINLQLASGLSVTTDSLTMSVAQGATNTGSATIVNFKNAYKIGGTTIANAEVDVDEGRLQFTAADANNFQDTIVLDLETNMGTNEAVAGLTTSYEGVDTVIATISGSNQAVDTLTFGGVELTYNSTDSTWTATLDGAGAATKDDPTGLGGSALVFTVDGTNPINTRSFTVEIKTGAMTNFNPVVYDTSFDMGSWTINGAQYSTPRMLYYGSYVSYLIIKTTGATTPDIFIDVENRLGETATVTIEDTDSAWKNGNSLYLSAAKILSASECSGFTATGADACFSAGLTFTIPVANVRMNGYTYNATTGDYNPLAIEMGTAAGDQMY